MNNNINIKEIIKIACRAGEIAMDFYDKEYTIEQKTNKTPVTEADMAINDYLIKELSIYNYPILSEEIKDDFEKRKNADFFWVVDPLDGTKDFIQKTGEFSIMIGLVNKKGESVLGVVYVPALDEMYYAQKNKGSFFVSLQRNRHCEERLATWQSLSENSQKIQVSKNKIKNGKILTSRNHLGEFEQQIAKKYNMEQIPAGSAGLKICWIARGVAELYINSSSRCGLWDTCAADIILKEAGGYITDKNQKNIKYNTKELGLLNGYIVSNIKYDTL
jgi:3'(2'), 5'-bisphosphate nucleotidase